MKMIREWRASWGLATRSVATVDEYPRYLAQLAARAPLEEATLSDVLEFVSAGATSSVQRQRVTACKALYRWANDEQIVEAAWWKRIPSLNEAPATFLLGHLPSKAIQGSEHDAVDSSILEGLKRFEETLRRLIPSA